jgi:hypothetical protein
MLGVKFTKSVLTCCRELPVILKAAVVTVMVLWKDLLQEYKYLYVLNVFFFFISFQTLVAKIILMQSGVGAKICI